MNAIYIDTEVNSLEAREPIEVAWRDFSEAGTFIQRFRPEGEIEAGAALVHGILPCDLEDCPPASEAPAFVPKAKYWIGHNIDFDWGVLGSPDSVKRICTLALCRHLWPEILSHKLGALVYESMDLVPEARELLENAHAADADVNFLSDIILPEIYAKAFDGKEPTPAALWKLSEVARIPTTMPFGKHRGDLIVDLPRSYRTWILKQTDFDPYLVEAVEKSLA